MPRVLHFGFRQTGNCPPQPHQGDEPAVDVDNSQDVAEDSRARARSSPKARTPGTVRSSSVGSTSAGSDGSPKKGKGEVLDQVYPVPAPVMIVRNTFLEFQMEPDPSLHGFLQERGTISCPGSGLEPGARGSSDEEPDPEPNHRADDQESVSSVPSTANSERLQGSDAADGIAAEGHDADGFYRAERPFLLSTGTSVRLPQADPVVPSSPPALPPGVWAPTSPCREASTPKALPPPPQHEPNLPAVAGSPGAASAPAPGAWPGAPASPGGALAAPLPSVGSAMHGVNCKPCVFVWTKGCSSGTACVFCHLCDAGEKKRRQKVRRDYRFERRREKEDSAAAPPALAAPRRW